MEQKQLAFFIDPVIMQGKIEIKLSFLEE